MRELKIHSIALPTKDNVLVPIGEANYKACFRNTAEDVLDVKFQNVLQNKDSPLNNCVTLIVFDE